MKIHHVLAPDSPDFRLPRRASGLGPLSMTRCIDPQAS